MFTSQSRHVAAPVTILYFPATQPTHVPPLGPVYPRLQRHEPIAVSPEDVCPEFDGQGRQVLSAVAPTVAEYLPATQSVHAALPATGLYFPAAHKVHDPTGPVEPAVHSEDTQLLDPALESEFTGQF